jgi:hypothetical protein
MTDAELEAIEKTSAQAAPGDWTAVEPYRSSEGPRKWSIHDARGNSIATVNQGETDEEDARFIAGSRSWVPALVAEVRRLRGDAFKLTVRVLCGGGDETKWRCFAKDFLLPFAPQQGLPVFVGKHGEDYVDVSLANLHYDPESREFECLTEDGEIEDEDDARFYLDMGFREEEPVKVGRNRQRHLSIVKPPPEPQGE